jgi:hypothetical protein
MELDSLKAVGKLSDRPPPGRWFDAGVGVEPILRREMKGRLITACLVTALTLVTLSGPAGADNGPNQGNQSMVLTVDNPNVSCEHPTPGKKVEGDFGRTIFVSASKPIDFVTVKSGKDAYVVWSSFDKYKGKIKLSKDVSNYVVWICPKY